MTLFTKIINGEIPCYKIYEDEQVFAFLAKDQINLGHVLVVPKVEIDYFIDVPEPYYSAVFKTAKLISKAIQTATACKRVGTIIAGWDVPHFHYHLVPMFEYHDLDPARAKEYSKEEMEEVQGRIIEKLI
jgi:histidine triad (HIT) family protein